MRKKQKSYSKGRQEKEEQKEVYEKQNKYII